MYISMYVHNGNHTLGVSLQGMWLKRAQGVGSSDPPGSDGTSSCSDSNTYYEEDFSSSDDSSDDGELELWWVMVV